MRHKKNRPASRTSAERSKRRGATGASSGSALKVRRGFAKALQIVRQLLLISVCCGLSFGLYSGWQWLLSKPVGHVDVQGRFVFVEQAQLEEVIAKSITDGFLELDLRSLKETLQRLEWVDEAQVSRQWPDTVKVLIVEHKPIARWGDGAVLNHRGEIIRFSRATDLSDLPLLRGPDAKSGLVMQQYQEMAELLGTQGLELQEVNCDLAENWVLQLKGGVEVNVGRHQVVEKLGRFLLVYRQQLKARWIELKKIDLRYDNGVAVEWRV